jgi:hypothetical protein
VRDLGIGAAALRAAAGREDLAVFVAALAVLLDLPRAWPRERPEPFLSAVSFLDEAEREPDLATVTPRSFRKGLQILLQWTASVRTLDNSGPEAPRRPTRPEPKRFASITPQWDCRQVPQSVDGVDTTGPRDRVSRQDLTFNPLRHASFAVGAGRSPRAAPPGCVNHENQPEMAPGLHPEGPRR